MSFPNTQASLIIRLSQGGSETDWQQFLSDYWGPVTRFAARRGNLPLDQAEDVAGEVFVVLIRSTLIARWHDDQSGRLRSLLCGVVRNLLSNRYRVEQGRQRLLRDAASAGGIPEVLPGSDTLDPGTEDLDSFYQAWVDELLSTAMQHVLAELQAEGRGDYFRSLYGRICEGLSAEEIGAALGVSAATIENQLRIAKGRLSRCLSNEVRRHVESYSTQETIETDFENEWSQLGLHLEKFGGLEGAIRLEAVSLDRLPSDVRKSESFIATSTELRQAATEAKGSVQSDRASESEPGPRRSRPYS
jgi:RNA polymerase sigma factor (sigma-70 family)